MIALILLVAIGTLIYYGVSKYKLHFDQEAVIPTNLVGFLGAVVLGFNILLFETNPGIGWSLFFAMFFSFFLFLFPKEKRGFFVYFFTITGILAGLALAGRANDFMLGINLTILFFSTIFLLILKTVADAETHIFAFLRGVWASFFGIFRQFRNLYLFAQTHQEKGKFNILQILKTATITIVIMVIFVALLSNADPVFAQIMQDFFGNFEARLTFSLIITVLIVLGFTVSIKPKNLINTELSFLNYYDFIVPLSVLITLLAVFLAIQFTYLFGAQADLSAFDLTFSEYVRKGFLELLIATFFGILVSITILLKQEHLEEKENKILKIVHFVLLIELFLMLLSALKRDLIYIDSYGLTRIRVVGGVFLAWLGALFVLIIGANFTQKVTQKCILVSASGFALVCFLVLNLGNIDQFIINYNTQKFPNKIDVFYNSLLSEDAIQGWEETILTIQKNYNQIATKTTLDENEKKLLAESILAIRSLNEKRNKLFDYYGSIAEMKSNDFDNIPEGFPDDIKYNRKWQSRNLAKQNAFEMMQKKSAIFEQTLACLYQNIDFYQIKNSINLQAETSARLDEYDYPLTRDFYYYNDLYSIKRELFEYFLNRYYATKTDTVKNYSPKIEYAEALVPIFEKIKMTMQINPQDLEDYTKRDNYYAEFEKLLIELISVEKCE